MLSNSESEKIALSKAVKEVMFIIQLWRSIKILVKLQVMVRVDNVEALYMASNITITSHTKYMDDTYKYMNEFMEEKVKKNC